MKNVTGYDLHKLLIGSLGTLAVITRLNFRTFPLPPLQRMFVATFADPLGAMAFCRAIMQSPLQPRVVDVLNPRAAGLFAAYSGGNLGRDSWLAVVEAAGHEKVLERHARDLASMSREAQAAEFIALDEDQREHLFGCLCEFSPIAFGATSAATVFRIAALPSAIPALLELRHSDSCSWRRLPRPSAAGKPGGIPRIGKLLTRADDLLRHLRSSSYD